MCKLRPEAHKPGRTIRSGWGGTRFLDEKAAEADHTGPAEREGAVTPSPTWEGRRRVSRSVRVPPWAPRSTHLWEGGQSVRG